MQNNVLKDWDKALKESVAVAICISAVYEPKVEIK